MLVFWSIETKLFQISKERFHPIGVMEMDKETVYVFLGVEIRYTGEF